MVIPPPHPVGARWSSLDSPLGPTGRSYTEVTTTTTPPPGFDDGDAGMRQQEGWIQDYSSRRGGIWGDNGMGLGEGTAVTGGVGWNSELRTERYPPRTISDALNYSTGVDVSGMYADTKGMVQGLLLLLSSSQSSSQFYSHSSSSKLTKLPHFAITWTGGQLSRIGRKYRFVTNIDRYERVFRGPFTCQRRSGSKRRSRRSGGGRGRKGSRRKTAADGRRIRKKPPSPGESEVRGRVQGEGGDTPAPSWYPWIVYRTTRRLVTSSGRS